MKHTKGPWKATERERVLGNYSYDIQQDERHPGNGGQVVARVALCVNTMSEHDANASLIAAAPELLDAAKKAFAFTEDADWTEILFALKAAIAKAEGGSK